MRWTLEVAGFASDLGLILSALASITTTIVGKSVGWSAGTAIIVLLAVIEMLLFYVVSLTISTLLEKDG